MSAQYSCPLAGQNYDYSRYNVPVQNYAHEMYPSVGSYDREMCCESVRAEYEGVVNRQQQYYSSRTESAQRACTYIPCVKPMNPASHRDHTYNILRKSKKATLSAQYDRLQQYNAVSSTVPQIGNVIPAAGRSTPVFLGKDPSYPAELNSLMTPFYCQLCNSRLNSVKSANIHYESKVHDRHITSWLKKTYSDNGLEAPTLKRYLTETAVEMPVAYHCELCKLDLSSAQHALQHYNGKRHRNAVTKITQISGIGYFNMDGKWVETGKVFDKVTGKQTSYVLVSTPTGFEPVVLYEVRNQPVPLKRAASIEGQSDQDGHEPPDKVVLTETEAKPVKNTPPKLDTATPAPVNQTLVLTPSEYEILPLECHTFYQTQQTIQDALDSRECKLCKISTTSRDQMLLHLKGIRHSKKLKTLGEASISPIFQNTTYTILSCLNDSDASDMSMYRTPSGSYYCKSCNTTISDTNAIKRHIQSKVHLAVLKIRAKIKQ